MLPVGSAGPVARVELRGEAAADFELEASADEDDEAALVIGSACAVAARSEGPSKPMRLGRRGCGLTTPASVRTARRCGGGIAGDGGVEGGETKLGESSRALADDGTELDVDDCDEW